MNDLITIMVRKKKNYVERENENDHRTWWIICLVFTCICFLFCCIAVPTVIMTQVPWCGECPPNSTCRYGKCICDEEFIGQFCNVTTI